MLNCVFDKLDKAGFDDVRPAHGAVSRNIARDGSRIAELAKCARMTEQGAAELVEYLRERRYIELVPDPSDGRAKLVRLTARGWKVHGTLVRVSREFEKECARSLGEDKWRQLRALGVRGMVQELLEAWLGAVLRDRRKKARLKIPLSAALSSGTHSRLMRCSMSDLNRDFRIWTQPLCKGVLSVMTGFRLHPYIRPL